VALPDRTETRTWSVEGTPAACSGRFTVHREMCMDGDRKGHVQYSVWDGDVFIDAGTRLFAYHLAARLDSAALVAVQEDPFPPVPPFSPPGA
jgi:hypothetical protein